MASAPLCEMRGIYKYFAKVTANRDVNFSINRGETVALLGENGAGKSTLMKILYGLYRADSGEILIGGAVKKIQSPREAMALGISMIQQHFSLAAAHSVTENIILGNVHGRIDYGACEAAIARLAETHGFSVNPKARIRDLSVGEQQKVEILKALYQGAELLVMDEPTAVLTPRETESLMAFVKSFAAQGRGVVFITHKLKEVMEAADRIVVMRNGEVCGNTLKADTDEKKLARMMIGRDLAPVENARAGGPGREGGGRRDTAVKVLEAEGLCVRGEGGIPALEGISFSVSAGEILGIAGVSGNGQQELCEAICGAREAGSGSLRLLGEDLGGLSIRERIEKGIGYVVSNRHKEGLIMDMTVAENMILKKSRDPRWVTRGGFLNKRNIDEFTSRAIEEYRIKTPGGGALAGGLSGGNQQKVVLAREVDCGGRLIIFDQPTRGLDLGAIDNVHKTILREREKGKAILLVSTELSEIFALSDRIAVMYKGRLMGVYPRDELDTEKTGLRMAGYALPGDQGRRGRGEE